MRTQLAALAVSAAALFTANIDGPSLPSLDDCFYARKGVEMERAGRFYTVTWNGAPTFQNPPLQIWILSRSFALLGERDGAARLPSALMALGLAVMTWAIGRTLLGEAEAATAAALLLATPLLANNARRCMMDVPLTFWTTLALLVFVGGLRRPRLHALLAVPLGAALLTKSVLGLLPLLVMGGAMVSAEARRALRAPWLWLGVAGGLALGASWPAHQWLAFGPGAVREHYLGEILSRAAAPLPLWRRLLGYPLILVERFQPVVVPAIGGLVLLWKSFRRQGGSEVLVVAWIAVPLLLYSASSAQAPRYVFPLLPALALAGGCWIQRRWPGLASGIRYGVPALLAVAAAVFWLRPGLLREPGNDALKQNAARVASATGSAIPYSGTRYWTVANPFLYYSERLVEAPVAVADAAAAARARTGLLLVDADRLHEVQTPHETVVAGREWRLVRLVPIR